MTVLCKAKPTLKPNGNSKPPCHQAPKRLASRTANHHETWQRRNSNPERVLLPSTSIMQIGYVHSQAQNSPVAAKTQGSQLFGSSQGACLQAMAECIDALKLPAVRPYFTASVFLKMSKDMQGTISIPCFHHYIVRKNAMLQTVSTPALILYRC